MKPNRAILFFLVFLWPILAWGQDEDKVKFVVQKAGASVPVIQILQDLNFQFRGKKIFVAHPTVLSSPPITFHSTQELSYSAIRAVLEINGIDLIEADVNGISMVTAYSSSNIPSLRSVSTPYYEVGEDPKTSESVVTQAFNIDNIDPNTLYALIRSIIFQDPRRIGNVYYVRGAKAMIIRDLKPNVQYYGRIIRTLDQKQESASIKVVKLENASAEEIGRIATQLIQAETTFKQSQGNIVLPAQVVGDKRTNKVIILAPAEDMKKYEKMIRDLDEKIQETSTGMFHVIKLQNVKAEDLGTKLNDLLTGQQQQFAANQNQPGGSNPAQKKLSTRIIAEPKSNSLIIQSEEEEYKKIVKLVEQLDVSPPQVLIEAHIFEVEDSRSLNVGTELATFDPSSANSLRGAGLTNFGLSQLVIDPSNPNRITRIPNAATGVIAGLHKGGFDRLPLILNLLGTDRGTNILAEPFAVTNDNEEAIFKDETEIPTLQQNQTTSNVNFVTQQGSVTASTTLKITPHISPQDFLRLDIDLQLEDFGAQAAIANTTPPKTRRSYKGSVTVRNGKFLVIGGLTRKDFSETINKVPLLGDIPLLGYLFSNRTKTDRKLNVYIFIRAYVLQKDSNRADRVTKYWLDNSYKASEHEPRENYGADMTRGQIKKEARDLIFEPSDNLLGK